MGNPVKAYRVETERLVIRCYQPADATMLKRSIDESLEHLRPWMPWALNEPELVEEKVERLRYFRAMFDSDEDYVFGIFNGSETELIGSTGLHTRLGADAREIGYWINAKYLRQGYATETVSALVKVGFELEQLLRIEIHCDPRNSNSAAIPAKLGFKHEATLASRLKDVQGTLRDKMIWTLFREQYEQTPLVKYPVKAFNACNVQIM